VPDVRGEAVREEREDWERREREESEPEREREERGDESREARERACNTLCSKRNVGPLPERDKSAGKRSIFKPCRFTPPVMAWRNGGKVVGRGSDEQLLARPLDAPGTLWRFRLARMCLSKSRSMLARSKVPFVARIRRTRAAFSPSMRRWNNRRPVSVSDRRVSPSALKSSVEANFRDMPIGGDVGSLPPCCPRAIALNLSTSFRFSRPISAQRWSR